MRKVITAMLIITAMGCVTEPEARLEVGYRVEGDSLVIFEAQAPDTLWWKLEWVDFNNFDSYLWDYGRAVYEVEVPVLHQPGFKFWLDFTAWTKRDTVVVTFMGKRS